MCRPEPDPLPRAGAQGAEPERGSPQPELEHYLGTNPIPWAALERFLAVPDDEFWTNDVLAPVGWDVPGPPGEGSPPEPGWAGWTWG